MAAPEFDALVVLGGLPWSDKWKRNQTMTHKLRARLSIERALYLGPGLWLGGADGEGGSLGPGELWRSYARLGEADGIGQYAPVHFLPLKDRLPGILRLENRLNLLRIREYLGGRYLLLVNRIDRFLYPMVEELIAGSALSLFDFSDDFLEFVSGSAVDSHTWFLSHLLPRFDLVLAVNDAVCHRYRPYNGNILTLRNGCHFDTFSRSEFLPVPALSGAERFQAVIGYIGTANAVRIDLELVRELAAAHRQWLFVFAGFSDAAVRDALSCDNVVFLPPVPSSEVPDLIHRFDVCMVPFQVNDHTQGNDLLKVYEYLAQGKPVITTGAASTDELGSLVEVAGSAAEFGARIGALLAGDDLSLVAQRKEYARACAWDCRIDTLVGELSARLAAKKGGMPRG